MLLTAPALVASAILVLSVGCGVRPPPSAPPPPPPAAPVPTSNAQPAAALPFFEVIEGPGSIMPSHEAVWIYVRKEDPKTLWTIVEHFKARYPEKKTLYLDFFRKKVSFDDVGKMSDAELSRVTLAEYYGGAGAKEEFFYTASNKPVPKP